MIYGIFDEILLEFEFVLKHMFLLSIDIFDSSPLTYNEPFHIVIVKIA